MNSSQSSFDAHENLVRRIGLVILAVTVAIDILLRQMNLETPILSNTLTIIEFLAVGLLVWVFVSNRRRQKTRAKPDRSRLTTGQNRKSHVPTTQKNVSTSNDVIA
ncbi:MAG: hypothetical protein ACLP5V_15360 [Candidatus Bathyarchaeia archaeon]